MPRGVYADIPRRQQLEHWDEVCRYLDSQPYRAVSHPFPSTPALSVRLFKRMALFGLVRHCDSNCTYRLARNWQVILNRLWNGLPDEDVEPLLTFSTDPFIADTNVDTMYVSLYAPVVIEGDDERDPARHLPIDLLGTCTTLKELAQTSDKGVESPWSFFDVPLSMWKSGIGTKGKNKGVSWSFLLQCSLVTIRLRVVPLGELIGSVRLSSETLWKYGPKASLDEMDRVVKAMWDDMAIWSQMSWHTAQVHLCADVANFRPRAADLDRVVSHSRKRALYTPSIADESASFASDDDGDEEYLFFDDLEDDPLDVPYEFSQEVFTSPILEDEDGNDLEEDEDDAELIDEQGAAVYLYAARTSGFSFSPGSPLSAVWYDKELEERTSGKKWMRAYHIAGGWVPGMTLTRVEVRFMRELGREFVTPGGLAWWDNPWMVIQHLNDYWGYAVGIPPEHNTAPDVNYAGWMRLTVPQGEDTNKRRWPTDPVWEVIQRATFTESGPPVPLHREETVVHDPDAIDAVMYGLLKLRSVIFGRQMDTALTLSHELRSFAQRMEEVDELKHREYYDEVREKARSLGRIVPMKAYPVVSASAE